jgi:hypothetical protein
VRSLPCLLAALVLVAGCASDGPSPLPTGGEPAELDPSDFGPRIDNPWWPMRPGTRWVYRETDGEGGEQRVEMTVTQRTREVLGIDARVVHDVVTEDGRVVEDTYDWYAQDDRGNVWYLGEDTREYAEDGTVSTEGSWEAGVDGAQAGILVPAQPEVGMRYRQEYLAGEAEDAAEVVSLDARAVVPAGRFEHVLTTLDTTPLEPGLVERKHYARGIGPVLAVTVAGGRSREELVRFERP